MPGMLLVTLVHVAPPSRVTCTSPSLLPVQITPAFTGDSASPYTTSAYSTPMLSGVSPPEMPCFDLSLRVRSGLITCQLLPPSVVTCTNWLPTYTRLWSNGEIVIGNSQLKRDFRFSAGEPTVVSGQTSP